MEDCSPCWKIDLHMALDKAADEAVDTVKLVFFVHYANFDEAVDTVKLAFSPHTSFSPPIL